MATNGEHSALTRADVEQLRSQFDTDPDVLWQAVTEDLQDLKRKTQF